MHQCFIIPLMQSHKLKLKSHKEVVKLKIIHKQHGSTWFEVLQGNYLVFVLKM